MEHCEILTKAGIDTESFLKRLMGNEALVRVFIKKFADDTTFSELKAALDDNDMKLAEMNSHTLKGMCGNMSLEELYGLFTEQVNYIRSGEFDKAKDMMDALSEKYCRTISYMKEWLNKQ